jgi:Mlc titration factor MtfA (ptsG expression regulator)
MLLEENGTYFQTLNEKGKPLFDKRVTDFLNDIRIVGVDTTVNDKDRILIAASAVIPVFAFPTWQYHDLDEVIEYPDNFNENFETTGPDRYFRGLVDLLFVGQVANLAHCTLRRISGYF